MSKTTDYLTTHLSSSQTAPVGKTEHYDHKRSSSDGSIPQKNNPQIIIDINQETKDRDCFKLVIFSLGIIVFFCLFIFLGRDYIKYLLLFIEKTDISISFAIFAVLFTIVSFPVAWGYVLLNVAAGYLFGLTVGAIFVALCAPVGILIAHLSIRRFCNDVVMSKLLTNNLQSLIKIVESGQGMKVIILARLTPIPFGLQNAVFAISNIGTVRYLIASILGLLPTQVLNAYIGSTLRSMEEVVSDKSQNITGYLVFIIQLLVTLLLLAYIIRKAKLEFNKALDSDVELSTPTSLSEPVTPTNTLSKPFINNKIL